MNSEQEKSEQEKLVLEYIRLAGEAVLKGTEMERIQKNLNLSHEEIVRLGKEKVLTTDQKS